MTFSDQSMKKQRDAYADAWLRVAGENAELRKEVESLRALLASVLGMLRAQNADLDAYLERTEVAL